MMELHRIPKNHLRILGGMHESKDHVAVSAKVRPTCLMRLPNKGLLTVGPAT